MPKDKVSATPLRGLSIRSSAQRPDVAVLELQVDGSDHYYLLPRSKLRDLADNFNRAADAASSESLQ